MIAYVARMKMKGGRLKQAENEIDDERRIDAVNKRDITYYPSNLVVVHADIGYRMHNTIGVLYRMSATAKAFPDCLAVNGMRFVARPYGYLLGLG